MMPRLFIAIDLPREVKEILGRLRVEIPGVRWVPTEQLHLTLAFLGDQDGAMIDRLKEALAAIREEEFALVFTSVGAFPDLRRPRVLWAGIRPERSLERLASRVRDEVTRCGVSLESRPYSPHITLARIKLPTAGRTIAERFRSGGAPEVPAVQAREFILYESRLTSDGAIHSPVARFPLHPRR